jgi:hypothetical protein
MKYIIVSFLIFSSSVFAMNCGQTQTSSTTDKKEVEAFTQMPSHLKGSKIVIEKANGTREVLKAEEYMVVKRKHTRPMISEKVVTSTMQCKEVPGSVKNIVSLRGVNSYANPETSVSGKTGKASISRENTLGAQYQRNVGKDVFLGVEGDLNRGAGISIGVGF